MRDELRRMAMIGSGIAELTRNSAEQIVKDLVKSGDVRREQASSIVKELMDRSKETRKELLGFVRTEIQSQIEGLGVASARDVQRLERRVTRLEDRLKQGAAASKKTTRKKTTRKKTSKSTAAGSKPRGAGS